MLACVVWTLSISHVLRQVCAGLNVPCPCLLTISRLKFHSRGVQLVPSDCEEEAVSACTCLEHVFSLQLVPHRQQDITLFLHDSNFSLLHVPRFIIIIIFKIPKLQPKKVHWSI